LYSSVGRDAFATECQAAMVYHKHVATIPLLEARAPVMPSCASAVHRRDPSRSKVRYDT
jgi:hypothetical protein